jgi:CRP/FNR family cyclic AMP-dependent transcriptional regulator
MSKETDFLQRVPLFADLPAETLESLAGRLRRRRLPPNMPVVYKGDPSGAMYLIASGRVKVHQATAGGDEIILNVLASGDFFGEMSLIDGQPRSADISTLEATDLLLLEGDALRDTIHEQPLVAWTLLRLLSQRLRDQNERMEALMTRDVAGRVADCLLRLAKTQGTPLPGGKSICVDARLTQSDIAALVGATRERVSRALSAFRASGLISWDKDTSRWIICKPDALAKRAQM